MITREKIAANTCTGDTVRGINLERPGGEILPVTAICRNTIRGVQHPITIEKGHD